MPEETTKRYRLVHDCEDAPPQAGNEMFVTLQPGLSFSPEQLATLLAWLEEAGIAEEWTEQDELRAAIYKRPAYVIADVLCSSDSLEAARRTLINGFPPA